MSNLTLNAEALLGEVDIAGEIIEQVLDLGRIAMASEMLGNTEEAFEITVSYLKERKAIWCAHWFISSLATQSCQNVL